MYAWYAGMAIMSIGKTMFWSPTIRPETAPTVAPTGPPIAPPIAAPSAARILFAIALSIRSLTKTTSLVLALDEHLGQLLLRNGDWFCNEHNVKLNGLGSNQGPVINSHTKKQVSHNGETIGVKVFRWVHHVIGVHVLRVSCRGTNVLWTKVSCESLNVKHIGRSNTNISSAFVSTGACKHLQLTALHSGRGNVGSFRLAVNKVTSVACATVTKHQVNFFDAQTLAFKGGHVFGQVKSSVHGRLVTRRIWCKLQSVSQNQITFSFCHVYASPTGVFLPTVWLLIRVFNEANMFVLWFMRTLCS